MEIITVVRRWQEGESRRAIAGGSGVARQTVGKYLCQAQAFGLGPTGLAPTGCLPRQPRLVPFDTRPAAPRRARPRTSESHPQRA
jgi:hypothetical protein